ncbi:MAG: hypothetical protein R3F43_03755 [bacterium]
MQARHRPTAGRLELSSTMVPGRPSAGVDGPDATRLESMPLPAGQYTVRVQPRDGADYNFYDVELRVETQLCVPGAVQREPCERCGQRESVCGADGRFGPPGECMGAGECEAGTTREVACGDCGTATERCDDACVWLPAACMNEGECEPGAGETRACDGSAQVRTCGAACVWSDYGACSPNACADGEMRECYEGPAGTAASAPAAWAPSAASTASGPRARGRWFPRPSAAATVTTTTATAWWMGTIPPVPPTPSPATRAGRMRTAAAICAASIRSTTRSSAGATAAASAARPMAAPTASPAARWAACATASSPARATATAGPSTSAPTRGLRHGLHPALPARRRLR